MKTVTINHYLVNGIIGKKVWGRNQKEIKAEFPELKNEKLLRVNSEKWQIGNNEKLISDKNGRLRVVSIND